MGQGGVTRERATIAATEHPAAGRMIRRTRFAGPDEDVGQQLGQRNLGWHR